MATYYTVRGWIETTNDYIDDLKSVIMYSMDSSELSKEQISLYKDGWVFPKNIINWSSFIFFGADVQYAGVVAIRNALLAITRNIPEIDAYFLITDEERLQEETVRIIDSKFIESDAHI